MEINKLKTGFIYGITFILLILTLFNQYLMIKVVDALTINKSSQVLLTGDSETDAQLLIFSKGIPEIYGPELKVMYEFDLIDQKLMDSMIKKMETFDRGNKKITLSGEKLERYAGIGIKISCEFCCSAKSIIHSDGTSACGCAHSAAMRGLMAYLIEFHGEEYTDDEILRELARWKALFFPKQMIKKYIKQTEEENYTPDIAALLVGAKTDKRASKNIKIPLPSEIKNLPDMAGGC